jgi:uncharacterized protein YfdQ (DUF2303 family)
MATNATADSGKQIGNVQAGIDLALRLGAVEIIEANGVKFASVPDGHGGRGLHSIKKFIDEYLAAPERKKGTAALTSLESLIAHAKRHGDVNSALFAAEGGKPSLTVVYDYNEGGPKGGPRFGQHRATYNFPFSDEWSAWMAIGGRPMSQVEFAEFLEDRIGDVMKPEDGGDSIKEFAVNLGIDLASAQHLMSLARSLKISVESNVAGSTNLSSGEGEVVFRETHKTEGGVTVRIPGGFAIKVPVFRLGELWQIPVRLRYRVVGGKISWTVGLHRTDVVFNAAFKEGVEKAAEETSLPLFYGAPES